MTINSNGKSMTIEFTPEQLRAIYWEAREQHMRDWVASLLEEYNYPEQDAGTLAKITGRYIKHMENGCRLGELEHDVFEYTMEHDFPYILADD